MYKYKENNEPIIILLCGKARNGKSTFARYIKNIVGKNRAVQVAIASTLKNYVKMYFNWDGNDETKPRELLQILGTDIIRKKLNKEKLFINRTIEDINIMKHFFDIFIIDDIRLEIEINEIKKSFKKVYVVQVLREDNKDNDLSNKEKKHITEIGLDNFKDYDYIINNNGSLKDLENKAKEFIESCDLNEN